jgi:2-polyprenyl-6-methoxyphenol hydroxylase-like FAD-dependent oxidoreductase
VGQCTINGFLPASKVTLPNGCSLPFVVFTPQGFVMAVPIDKEGETLAWGITTDVAEKDRAGWTTYETSGQAARDGKALFDDITTEPLRSVLDNAVESEAKVWPHHSIGDMHTWHKGRICLLGDAAHALPPNGQGSALAFEDAAYLSRLLGSSQAREQGYDRLFAHFEAKRRIRVAQIRKSAKPSSAVESRSSPWVWSLKKWAFWAFFVWHGRVAKMGSNEAGDVMKESIEVL